ncbi:MAG: helix-turn-helix domain-containing protein [Candidatus Cryptobacteroides sp.]|jgi:transcriptional regulator with XRE-family HTH domain|nr:helix-turn-helix transcriptional regulator [Bacteroidota bacterium]NLN99270.1 helix-turn-helix domain-containing protein [Bacteroidales bacterium]
MTQSLAPPIILFAMDDSTIKDNLFRKRNELGISQREMANRLEISLNAYRKLEMGKTRILNEHVPLFAEVAGISVAELVNGFEPLRSVEAGLEDVKERYEQKIRVLETGYQQELENLKLENVRLKDRLKDKEDIIAMNKKLIQRYEKELKALQK